MYDIHNFYGPISISNLIESDLLSLAFLLYLKEDIGFKVQIKNKYEVPNFCIICNQNFNDSISISNPIESDSL